MTIDGHPVEFGTETIGHDTYTVLAAPGGQHTIEIVKRASAAQPAALAIAAPESEAEDATTIEAEPPQPSVAPNHVPSPESFSVPVQTSTEADLVEDGSTPTVVPEQAPPPTRTERIAARNAYETRMAVLQFASASLIILTCLTLMVLVAIRRLHRLS